MATLPENLARMTSGQPFNPIPEFPPIRLPSDVIKAFPSLRVWEMQQTEVIRDYLKKWTVAGG